MHTPNRRVLKHMKQKLIEPKEKIEKSTARLGDVNIPFSVIDSTSGQRPNMDIDLKNMANQLD